MKKQLVIRFVAIFVLCVASIRVHAQDSSYSGSKNQLHVYLLIGQSNMAGRAPYTEEESEPIERCFLLNGQDEWEPAKNPLNIFSTIRKGPKMQKMNPGYSFAQKMLQENGLISLGLVVNAKGGSKIEEWEKGKRFYDEIIRRAKLAQKTGTLKGILWHQGESNSGSPDQYLGQLTELVNNLRADLGEPNLPFVAGQIRGEFDINDEIAKLPDTVANTAVASSEDLTTMDKWHFDAKSMKMLGERYAEAMLKLVR